LNSPYANPEACEEILGNGESIALQTGPLPDDQYRFFVRARKPHSEGPLLENIELAVSIRKDLSVTCNPVELEYESPSYLEFPERQPFVDYQIVDENGGHLSEVLGEKNPAGNLPTFPLREDTLLLVHAVHALTDSEAFLDFRHLALIAPNQMIEIAAPLPAVAFGEDARIDLSNGQRSVTYLVKGQPRVRAVTTPAIIEKTYQPSVDGAFSVDFGPVKWPMTISVTAYKAEDRRKLPLAGNPEIAAYPDRGQEVRVVDAPDDYGDTALVQIEGADWDTQYQLLDGDNRLISNLASTRAPETIELRTAALEEDINARVQALGLVSGLSAILAQRAPLQVPPRLDLDAQLVNLPFSIRQGAEIQVSKTQASADYLLELKPFDEAGRPQPIRFSPPMAGGGDIIVPTGHLPELRYELRVKARKTATGLEGFLPQVIRFFAGVMTGNQVNIDFSVLNYGDSTTITVVQAQANATYQLFGANNQPLSEVHTTGPQPEDLQIPTYPLFEDDTLRVRISNLHSDASGFLQNEKSVLVYPNPDLNPVLEVAEVAFQGFARVRLQNAQRSVRYEFTRIRGGRPGRASTNATGGSRRTQPARSGRRAPDCGGAELPRPYPDAVRGQDLLRSAHRLPPGIYHQSGTAAGHPSPP
jgi:hypothetical protein